MSTAKKLHDQAMDLVERAVLERIRGNTESTVKLYADALELELAAIALLDEHGPDGGADMVSASQGRWVDGI